VLDVRRGIPYRDLELVFAEHFLEHLTFPEALDFLRGARAALAPGGVLRLSTPNLAWVWREQDPSAPSADRAGERVARALEANRAFHGWGHRFLWTREILEEALAACGFDAIRFCAYGESEEPSRRGLEQHERYFDWPDLPHVLVVEATRGEPAPERFEALMAVARARFLDHLEG